MSDANQDSDVFTISQIVGLTPQDIQDGFIWREGDEVTDNELAAYAQSSIGYIEKYFDNREINLENTYYGIFDGVDSSVNWGDFVIPTIPSKTKMIFEAAFDEETLDANVLTQGMTLMGNNIVLPKEGEDFTIQFLPNGSGFFNLFITYGSYNDVFSLDILPGFFKYEIEFRTTSSTVQSLMKVNNAILKEETLSIVTLSDPSVSSFFSVGNTGNGFPYKGYMKNLQVLVNDVLYIDCPRLYDGLSNGSLGNGSAHKVLKG